jgi:histidinol-phosphatase (PHP family)
MRFSSLHTHSLFCDGADDIETLCRVAHEKGLSAIGFSSHAPMHEKTFSETQWHIPPENFEKYLDAAARAKKRWFGKINVFIGLEVDYIKGIISPSDFKNLDLDYLIGSVHYVIPPSGEPFAVDGSLEDFERGLRVGYKGDIEKLAGDYWDAEEELIRAGGFSILGHIDLIKKNNGNGRFFSPQSRWYQDRLVKIADALSSSKIIVEVNTGGLNRGKTDELYPSPFLLRLLQQRHAPVMITADAHCAEHLDGHYADAAAALKTAGYAEFLLDPITGEKESLTKYDALSRLE